MEKTSKKTNRCSDEALNRSLPSIPVHMGLKLRRRDHLKDGFWPFLSSLAIHALFLGILSIPAFQIRTSTAATNPTVLWFSDFMVPDVNAELAEMAQTEADISGELEAGELLPAPQPAEEPVADDTSQVSAPEPASQIEPAAVSEPAGPAETEMVYKSPSVQQVATSPSPVPEKAPPAIQQVAEQSTRNKKTATPEEPAPPPMAERNKSSNDRPGKKEEADRIADEMAEQMRIAAEKKYREQVTREQEQAANAERLKQQQIAAVEKARQEAERREKLDQERAAQKEAFIKQEAARLAALREQEQAANAERLKQHQIAAAEKARQEAEKREKLDQERAAKKEALIKQEAARLAALREQEQRATAERLKQQQAAAAEKARQEAEKREKLDQERAAQKEALLKQETARLAALREQEQRASVERLKQQLAAAAAKVPVKEPVQKHSEAKEERQPSKTTAKEKGISIPVIKADLKLLIRGRAVPETVVTFKEFPLSRRNKPFTRNEAKKELKIITQVVKTDENSREVVIEKTAPGVYTFTVIPVNGKNDADFSLVLWEGNSGKRMKSLGNHSITAKKILLKILMPEGILWQDDKAFTGSMEDSTGITKFNAETGLMWKEYSD